MSANSRWDLIQASKGSGQPKMVVLQLLSWLVPKGHPMQSKNSVFKNVSRAVGLGCNFGIFQELEERFYI